MRTKGQSVAITAKRTNTPSQKGDIPREFARVIPLSTNETNQKSLSGAEVLFLKIHNRLIRKAIPEDISSALGFTTPLRKNTMGVAMVKKVIPPMRGRVRDKSPTNPIVRKKLTIIELIILIT
jgi:hypothetical protein